MSTHTPKVIVLAGPNGVGKTTAAPRLLRDTLGLVEFVNADTIAQGLAGFDPDAAALEAGTIMFDRIRQLGVQRHSFAFETTLASRSLAPWSAELLQAGYEFQLVFLWLPSPDLAVQRVADRVRLGGHNVSEATVHRRYERGLQNFFHLYQPMATAWRMYDNTDAGNMRLIARLPLPLYGMARSGIAFRESTAMATREPKDISAIFREGTLIDRAMNLAVRDAIRLHKEKGLPLVVQRDGKILWISPEEAERDWAAANPEETGTA